MSHNDRAPTERPTRRRQASIHANNGWRRQEGRQNLMTLRVRTITAVNLRLGDVVIPDHGPRRRVTLRRLEGAAHPVVVVEYEGIPGASVCYPLSMPLLIEESD
jgi:hypothetical protein